MFDRGTRDEARAKQSLAARSANAEKRKRILAELLEGPGKGITNRAKRALLLVAEERCSLEQAVFFANPDIERCGAEMELKRRIERRMYELLQDPPDWCREIVARIQAREEAQAVGKAAQQEELLRLYETQAATEVDFLRSWYERRKEPPCHFGTDNLNAFAPLADYFSPSEEQLSAWNAARELPEKRFLKLIGRSA